MVSKHTIQQFNKGDERAFKEIYNAYYFMLWSYLRDNFKKNLLSTEMEEIISDSFIYIWKIRGNFKSIDAVKLYLSKSVTTRAINGCIYAKRRNRNEKEYQYLCDDSEVQQESIFPATEELLSALDNAREARKITIMSLDGFKNEEIAELLKLSHQTVRNQKTRALGIIRKKFAAP